jgi:exopolysaccharide production protein ExoQ
MPPAVATVIFTIGIAGLFFLDRGEKRGVSKALWIPTVWLFFCTSRSPTQWLGMAATSEQAADIASAYLEGNPTDRNFFIALEVIALIVVISRIGRVGPILRSNWVIVLFFLYAALSMAWSDYPFLTLKHWIKGVGDVLMVLIVLSEASVAGAVKSLVTRLAFVLLPLSLLLLYFYPSLGRTHSMDWTPEPCGVATQKNGLGELCSFSGLALLWRFRGAYNDRKDPNRSRRLLALGTVLATNVWLLHMSNSMTSISALSMAGGVMFLSTRPAFRRKPALVHLLIGAVLAVVIYALFFQSSGALVQGLGRDPTLSGRSVGWATFLRVPNNLLVGAGYESFWVGSRLLKIWELSPGTKISEAHNGYIEMFLTLGWAGVVFLGVLITTGYRNVIGAYRRDPDIGSLRIAYFLSTVISGFTEAAFRMMSPTWIVFLLATFAALWMTQRKVSAVVTSTQEPDYFPDWGSSNAPLHRTSFSRNQSDAVVFFLDDNTTTTQGYGEEEKS